MNRPTAIVWLLTAALSACAQQKEPRLPVAAKQKPALEKVYTYMEQMPELPGGGGMQAIVNDTQKRFGLPVAAIEQDYNRAIVHFEVGANGNVSQVRMHTSSNSPAFDSALLATVRAFPRFSPGRQNGRAVAVSFDIPISVKPQ